MKNKTTFIKFCCVGLTNTLISLLIYYIAKLFGINYLLSMALGYVISSITGYFFNKIWVFKVNNNNKNIFRYYTIYILALILNLLTMNFQVEILGISENIAPFLTIIVTTLFNYFFSNNWVFNENLKFSIKDIKKEIRENKLYYFILSIFIFFLALLLVNNIYNHAVADDYHNYNTLLYQTTNGEFTTILEYIKAVVKKSIDIYTAWQGTYFSNILSSLNPLIISDNMYKFTMFMVQIIWLIISYLFVISFLNKKENKKPLTLLFMLFTIFTIIYSYSLGEGFYWFTGSVVYTIPYIMSLMLLTLIVYYLKNNKKIYLPFIIVLSILLGGTNYVTGLFIGFVYVCITLYMFIKKDKKKNLFLILLLIFAISFAFNVFCPGNFNRVATENDTSLLKIIYISIFNAFEMIRYLIFHTAYIPFMIIAFPSIKKLVKNSKLKFEYPLLLIILCSICFVCFFMPMSFAFKSFYQENRVKNIQLYYLIIMSTVCFINYYGYFYKNELAKETEENNKIYLLIGIIAFIIMLGTNESVQGIALIDDITKGTSLKYDLCVDNMNEALKNSPEEIVKLTRCNVYPRSLHYHIIRSNETFTDAIGIFYNKKIEVLENEN